MKIFTVDSFTNTPFAGNPAGVCILDKEYSDDIYLKIAKEINYSETAFVLKTNNQYNLRWFTPEVEVNLCGHATLASAKILFEQGYEDASKTIEFSTRSGILTTRKIKDKIEMNFPANEIAADKSDAIIEKAFNIKPKFVGTDGIWCLVELENKKQLDEINPDFELLKTHPKKIFIVTSKSDDKEFDFYSRCFGPAVGINEDPVTGSAHCYLATYWKSKLNKNPLAGFQASKRTGIVECEVTNNNRVLMRGNAVIMSEINHKWFVK